MISFIIKCFDMKKLIFSLEESDCRSSGYTRSLYHQVQQYECRKGYKY